MKGSAARLLWFGGVLLLGGVVLVPLRWVLPAGVSAAGATGNLWRGQLRAAQWGGLGLGDLELRLAALPLLAGVARVSVAGPGLSGTLLLGRQRGVEALDGAPQLAGLPLPFAGLRLSRVDLLFGADGCVQAGGRMEVQMAAPNAAMLAGTPVCDGADARVDLAGPDGVPAGRLRLGADGRITMGAP